MFSTKQELPLTHCKQFLTLREIVHYQHQQCVWVSASATQAELNWLFFQFRISSDFQFLVCCLSIVLLHSVGAASDSICCHRNQLSCQYVSATDSPAAEEKLQGQLLLPKTPELQRASLQCKENEPHNICILITVFIMQAIHFSSCS